MAGLIGERYDESGTPRYVRHPTAAAGWLQDGKPIDSASAFALDANLSVLSHESLRHWVADPGPGTLNYQGRGYSGLTDVPDIDGTFNVTDARAIAWDRRTAIRWGPFDAIGDRPLAGDAPGYGARKVRVRLDASGGANGSLVLFAALTHAATTQPPRLGYVAFGTKTLTAGRQRQDIDLTAEAALPPVGALTPCRPTSARGTTEAPVVWLYLWVGWYSSNAADALISVNAWETR